MINIHSGNGYLRLCSRQMANILQLGTQSFCRRFLDYKIDPCGRLRDQMEMATRTDTANIAEGSSRHQTSYESELRLLDVARASISELEGDYLNWLMRNGKRMWSVYDSRHRSLPPVQLQKRNFSQDVLAEMSEMRSRRAPHDCKERPPLQPRILGLHKLSQVQRHNQHLIPSIPRNLEPSNPRN